MVARARLNDDAGSGGAYFAKPKHNIKFIKTGCKVLDLALGGGWCRGRVANVVGDKSTGKTLLMIEACANFALQEPKGKIRYREIESAFDKPYAGALGMPLDRIDFGDAKKPIETVEDLFEDLVRIVDKARGPELVIVDSLDALSDRSEMDRAIDEGTFGAAKAKLMSQLFRRLVQKLELKDVTVLIVSQVRDKIGAMFGKKVTRSGGRALDFYASQVVFLAHMGKITRTVRKQERTIGVKVKALIEKNKVSLPFREAAFSIRFGYGVDDAQACIDWLVQSGNLKDTGIKHKDDTKWFLYELLDMSPAKADVRLRELQEATERRWYEIEQATMPARAKYANA